MWTKGVGVRFSLGSGLPMFTEGINPSLPLEYIVSKNPDIICQHNVYGTHCEKPVVAHGLCMQAYQAVRRATGGSFTPDEISAVLRTPRQSPAVDRIRAQVTALGPIMIGSDASDQARRDYQWLWAFALDRAPVAFAGFGPYLPKHGTVTRYRSFANPCRCDTCRAAWKDYSHFRRLINRYTPASNSEVAA